MQCRIVLQPLPPSAYPGTMDGTTLDVRCAELKSRMLAERDRGRDRLVSAAATAVLTSPTSQPSRQADTRPPEVPAVELRNPHPIVKAALAAKNDVHEDYGKMQFRWGGYTDIRVSRPSVRRALKILALCSSGWKRKGFRSRSLRGTATITKVRDNIPSRPTVGSKFKSL